jgi:hypothetical protein
LGLDAGAAAEGSSRPPILVIDGALKWASTAAASLDGPREDERWPPALTVIFVLVAGAALWGGVIVAGLMIFH